MSQYTAAYQQFFDSPAGLHFKHNLDVIIDTQHTTAENDPDKSRDYMQRAKGVREVINHINSVSAERNQTKVINP